MALIVTRPEKLLTQNSELRKAGVWNWTLPAFHVELPDGTRFNACPNAGVCARVCYARFGTYNFSNVKNRHMQNLQYVLDDLPGWEQQIDAELKSRRFADKGRPYELIHDINDEWLSAWVNRGGSAVRIHDAGDFFSLEYLQAWTRLAHSHPNILFYAYTKEVQLLKDNQHLLPTNFRVIYSFGGLQDNLIDRDIDRHADVFPDEDSLNHAGYFNQGDSDLLAVTAPTTKIGIVANNLPVANKRFAGNTMSGMNPQLWVNRKLA